MPELGALAGLHGAGPHVYIDIRVLNSTAVLSCLAVADAVASGLLRRVEVDLDLSREIRAVWVGPRSLSGAGAALLRAVVGSRPVAR